MKIAASPRPASRTAGDTGTARVDRRTARLLTRLGPGDVAVIDHVDLDRGTAQALADAGVAAVVNAQPMISGRFPNLGPEVLLDAGVTMVDGVGPQALRRIRDGARVHLDGHDVLVDGAVVATGRRLEADDVAEQLAAARSGLAAHLDSFTHNSTELLRREQRLLLGGEGLPVLAARLEGRTALVVLPGDEAASQLAQVRRFVRRRRPVLIGVDAGGDVLLDAGHRPDLLVLSAAALEDISAQVLARAREVVVRGEPGSGTAAWDAVERVAHRPHRVHTSLTSEDTALLLAHTGGASPIVEVGARAGLEDLLERGRTGLPSTFLTRLKTGPELVEARLLPALTPRRRRLGPLLLVLLVLALVAAAAAAPASRDWVRDRARDVQDRVGTSGPSAAGAPTARATAADPRSGQPADQAFDDAFAAAAASRVYADGLADRRVSVVTLPGAPADVVAGLTDQVEAAGGTVGSRVDLTADLVGTGGATLVDSLGSQLAAQVTSAPVDPAAPAYDRIGALVGVAVARPAKGHGREARADAATIRDSLVTAGLARVPDGAGRPGQLILVVLGDGDVGAPVLAGLLRGLASTANAVVAGASRAPALDALREDPSVAHVATVDGDERAAGRASTVLALVRSLTTRGGSFGASGADGAVPLL